jgi:antitoxin (DNA-binding transcriptional repressor) of toxin-antitoxin stability system
MITVSLQEAQAKLSELIYDLMAGDEVVITEEQPAGCAVGTGHG